MSYLEFIASIEIGLIYGIVAIGIYLTFRVIDFPDLTVDGSFVTGAAVCAILLKAGFNPVVALLSGGAGGAIAGLLTGALHVYGRVSSLLAGILTAFILYSINLRIMSGVPNISLLNEATLFGNTNALLVLTIIAVTIWLLISYLMNTDWGLALRTVGQNPKLASRYGIKPHIIIIFTLMLSNGLIGIGGALFCQHQSFVDVSQGVGTVIIGLAAVMIGEKVLPFRSMTIAILACLGGSILYRLVIAAALHSEVLGLQSSDLNLITGIIVISIMMLPKIRQAR